MKVLLINPAWGGSRSGAKRYHRAWPPLDLLTAAGLLRRHGHEPHLLDLRARPVPRETVRAAASAADLVVLQSTPLDRWQCPDLDWLRLVRLAMELPREKLVLAGAHGTLHPELFLKETGARALIRGEPEVPLAELAQAGGDPRGLAGLSYLDGGRALHEPDQVPVDLDALPPPAYDLVDLSLYRYELLGDRLALLETARGCPFSCSFCLKVMYGPGRRTKNLARVLEEIEEVVGRRGARHVYFIDLEFTLNRPFVLDLCRALISMNLDFAWCCQSRADTVDPDLLALMKAAGCRLVHFGVETGSPRLLEATRKKITLDQVLTAVRWCRQLGLTTACFFLFGLPGETAADRRATVRLARRLNPTYASFHIAAPYPGTELGRPAPGPEPFPACLEDEHNLVSLAAQARRAFLSFYLRPGYVLARLHEGTLRDKLDRLRLFWEFIR